MSFFSDSQLTLAPQRSLLPDCGACGLLKKCKSPKMPIDGQGKRGILIIGEAPGAEEDKQGIPFVGPAGSLLRETLSKNGIKMQRDCWITNSLICRPPNNATPTDQQIKYCQPNIIRAIEELKPEIIIPSGTPAIKSVLSYFWRDKIGEAARWIGWHIPDTQTNSWICPIRHPSFIRRIRDKKGPEDKVNVLLFNKHIKAISKIKERPWKEVPQYQKKVHILLDQKEVVERIERVITTAELAAFDYETNMLKPEPDKARIASASICSNGVDTFAFPWQGQQVKKAFRRFLRSNIPKIGANIKFEERWSRAVLNTKVNNWEWDCVQGAHFLDNRSGITSVKFQAFVLLGMPVYNQHIEPFLEADSGIEENKVFQIDTKDLLLYNGLDSLLEYLIAKIQMEKAIPAKSYYHEKAS